MKILIVCSGNYSRISPFVFEQAEAISNQGANVDFFLIKGKGILGYLRNITFYINKIKEFKPDIVHAHYGLSGLLACLQRKIPVVITFHGSDINQFKPRIFSWIASRLSKTNIFVSSKLVKILNLNINLQNVILPCGINRELFMPESKEKAKKSLSLDQNKKYILFTSAFDNPVKNYQLCYNTIKALEEEVVLIELKNYSRDEVKLLMNASELLLMTSFSEGSPQVVKEAIAIGLPIVSVDVGDIRDIQERTSYNKLFIASHSDLAIITKKVLNSDLTSEVTYNFMDYDNTHTATELLKIYNQIRQVKSDNII